MPDIAASPSLPTQIVAAPFGSILCEVNGSRAAADAVRQAAILAGPDGRLELLGIGCHTGHGLTEVATIAPHRLSAALYWARRRAGVLGANPEVRKVESANGTERLLPRRLTTTCWWSGHSTRRGRAGS